MSLKKIRADELQVGMYVVMPTSWQAHPFLKNKFRLTSRSQIDRIIEAGLDEVLVDMDRGAAPASKPPDPPPGPRDAAGEKPAKPPRKPKESGDEKPDLVTDTLREAIRDRKLPAEDKSRIVRDNAMTMMNGLLSKPTAKNIRAAREVITEIVELILTDDATTTYLTKITRHDFYTYTHSVNVGLLGIAMAKILFRGSNGHNMHELGIGFFLHDLGKVQIDQTIINKPGRLTEEEMAVMRRHPVLGYQLLYEAQQMTDECKTIVLQHHERCNGTGYPKELRGDEIHLYGKICSLADVYDALTSDRPYRSKMDPFSALILMKKEMIHHFQKDLYEKFVLMLS